MMYAGVALLLLATSRVVVGASIDEIIMKAAPKSSALDTFHMSPEGEVWMMVELDMRMDIKQYMELKGNRQVSRQKRKAIKNTDYRWKDCKVYYEINRNDFNAKDVEVIRQAMAEWEKYSCLTFKNDTSQSSDKIFFQRGSGGCYSRLGRVGGTQEIGLSKGCVHRGVVVHEIGHAIGWIHEQARPDRDQFIRVNYNRIPDAWHPQFDKFSESLIDDYDVRYDYRSIMHYSGSAVAPMSIETLDPKYQDVIGQRQGLSFRDVMLANLMYKCANMVCGKQSQDCTQFGHDAFLFKLNKGDDRCQCVCPGDSEDEVLRPCQSSSGTTPPPSTTTTTTQGPAEKTTEPAPMECLDLREDCAQLVKEDQCKMDMERMLMFCKKSCKFCEKDKMCMDYDPTCPLLALANFCDQPGFESVMAMKCKKSCQLCTPVDPCQMQLDMGLADTTSTGHITSMSLYSLLLLLSTFCWLVRLNL